MEIVFRKLTPGESRKYHTIRLECLKHFPDYFSSSYEEQLRLPKLPFETYIEKQTPDKYIVGAFDGDELIGICGVSHETSQKTKHIAEIIQMYIKPEYKGKKLGIGLLGKAVEEAFSDPETEQIVLGVAYPNASANHIYEVAGFTEYGRMKNYFRISADKYYDQRLMVLYKNHLK